MALSDEKCVSGFKMGNKSTFWLNQSELDGMGFVGGFWCVITCLKAEVLLYMMVLKNGKF